MLKRSFRLPARTNMVHAQYLKTPYFLLRYQTSGEKNNRFGFVISKKVAKLSVDRNNTKRRIRACIEQLLTRFQSPYDYLFVIQKNIEEIPFEVLFSEIEDALKKRTIIK